MNNALKKTIGFLLFASTLGLISLQAALYLA